MTKTHFIQTRHIDKRLREDIHRLGEILGNVLKAQHGYSLYRDVEKLRGLTKLFRSSGSNSAFVRIQSMKQGASFALSMYIFFWPMQQTRRTESVHKLRIADRDELLWMRLCFTPCRLSVPAGL